MDENLQPKVNRSAAGGINTRVFPLDIQDDEAVELRNIDTSTPGQRVKRGGTAIAATGMSFGPVLALAEYRKPEASGGETVLLAVTPGENANSHKLLYEWDGTGQTFDFVATLTGYTADPWSENGQIQIETTLDLIRTPTYFAMIGEEGNSGEDYWLYDGTTVLQQANYGAGGANGQRLPIQAYKSRMFATGFGGQRHRVYVSDVGAATTTMSGNARSISFGGQGKQKIVALAGFRTSELIVGLEDRLEKLNITEDTLVDPDTGGTAAAIYTSWSRDVIDTEIGVGSRESVSSSGADLIFADQHGNIRSVGRTIQDAAQGAESLPLSEPLDAWVKRVNPQARRRTVGQVFDRWYFLGMPIDDAEYADHVFALDLARSAQLGRPAWDGPWDGIDPFCMTVATLDGADDGDDKNPTMYVGQGSTADGGIVVKMFRGNQDKGADFAYQEVTKRHSYGTLDLKKQGRKIDVYAQASASVTLRIDASADAMGYQTVGYLNLLGDSPQLPQQLPFNLGGQGVVHGQFSLQKFGKWRDIQFRMTCTAGEEVKVLGYSVFAYPDNYDRQSTGGT